jgi:hypothetical protein
MSYFDCLVLVMLIPVAAAEVAFAIWLWRKR